VGLGNRRAVLLVVHGAPPSVYVEHLLARVASDRDHLVEHSVLRRQRSSSIPRRRSSSIIRSAASSAEVSAVSMWISGVSGGSYGESIPVKFLISPRRARS